MMFLLIFPYIHHDDHLVYDNIYFLSFADVPFLFKEILFYFRYILLFSIYSFISMKVINILAISLK